MNGSTAQKNFPHIFSKGKIGKYETTNRVKWAACCVSNYNNRDGSYSEREYGRDEVIGRMGCGIVTNQGAYPDKTGVGKAYWSQICLNDDRYIPGVKRVADIFHKNGSLAIQQILHALGDIKTMCSNQHYLAMTFMAPLKKVEAENPCLMKLTATTLTVIGRRLRRACRAGTHTKRPHPGS